MGSFSRALRSLVYLLRLWTNRVKSRLVPATFDSRTDKHDMARGPSQSPGVQEHMFHGSALVPSRPSARLWRKLAIIGSCDLGLEI